MPIIDHETIAREELMEYRSERSLVSRDQGATSLTIKEVELRPGWTGKLHIHPTDVAVMVMAGAVQMVLDDEVSTVRSGTTMLAPPGAPHKLVNNLWVPCRILLIYPAVNLETSYLE